jgi:hypothetical protein
VIDTVKIWFFGELATFIRRNESLRWNITIEEQTAEVGKKAWASFNGVSIEHRLPNRIQITVSLHQYWNDCNGHGQTNGNRFYHSDLCKSIDSLCQRLQLRPEQMRLYNMEYGLNIFDPPFDITATIDCFCTIYTKRFVDYPSEYGRFADCGQNIQKAYHKGKQQGTDLQTFRLENHIYKMQWLQTRGIKIESLADLKNLDMLVALHKELIKSIRNTTIHEPNAPIKGLSRKEKTFWEKSGNPLVWKGYTPDEITEAYKAHKAVKARICTTSTNEVLVNLLNDEFALLSGVKLIDSKKSYRVDQNEQRKNLTKLEGQSKKYSYPLDERYEFPPRPHDPPSIPAFTDLDQVEADQDSGTCKQCPKPIGKRGSSARYCSVACKRQWEAKHKRTLRRSHRYGNAAGQLFDGW